MGLTPTCVYVFLSEIFSRKKVTPSYCSKLSLPLKVTWVLQSSRIMHALASAQWNIENNYWLSKVPKEKTKEFPRYPEVSLNVHNKSWADPGFLERGFT